MIGRVVSAKNLKTATVLVTSTKRHPLYKKTYIRTKKYQVHDELGVKVGDIVNFIPCAPVSKHKHWKITKVVGKDEVAIGTEQLKKSAQAAIEQVIPEEKVESKTEAVIEKKPEQVKGKDLK